MDLLLEGWAPLPVDLVVEKTFYVHTSTILINIAIECSVKSVCLGRPTLPGKHVCFHSP